MFYPCLNLKQTRFKIWITNVPGNEEDNKIFK